jgi:hypothetical protein
VALEIIRHSRISLGEVFKEDFKKKDPPEWLTMAGKRRERLISGLARTKAMTAAALFAAIALALPALLSGQPWEYAIHNTARPTKGLGWVDTVLWTITTAGFELAPIMVILGLYLLETSFILKRRLDESAKLLRNCQSYDRLGGYLGLRVAGWAFAAVLLGVWTYNRADVLASLHWPNAMVALGIICVMNTILAFLMIQNRSSLRQRLE